MAIKDTPPSKLTVEPLVVTFLFVLTGLVGVAYGARRTWLPLLASRHGGGAGVER